MAPYWNEVVNVFEALSYIIKQTDPDGIELYFAGPEEHCKSKKTTKSLQIIKERHPDGN
jgi:hypothetical protein